MRDDVVQQVDSPPMAPIQLAPDAIKPQNSEGGPSLQEVCDSEQQGLDPCLSLQHFFPPLVRTSNGFNVLDSSNDTGSVLNMDPSSIALGADPIPGNE
ncbi:unnamed protein product [Amaranthus hypochondriacus]